MGGADAGAGTIGAGEEIPCLKLMRASLCFSYSFVFGCMAS